MTALNQRPLAHFAMPISMIMEFFGLIGRGGKTEILDSPDQHRRLVIEWTTDL
jgi:hypothetical protein